MNRALAGAALLPLVMACGAGGPEKQSVVTIETSKPVHATFALGSSMTHEGAIETESAGDSFRCGVELFLSVDVTSASTDQTIEVQWIDSRGIIAHRETRNVSEGGHYAAFSSGNTSSWSQGTYRAVVSINARKVNERSFAML